MTRYLAFALALMASPASAQQLPPKVTLSSALVMEIFTVLNASGAANATVTRLQAEVQHQPEQKPDPPVDKK